MRHPAAAQSEVLFCSGESCRKDRLRSVFSKKQLQHPEEARCKVCVAKQVVAQKVAAVAQQAAARAEVLFCNGESCRMDKPRHEFNKEQKKCPTSAVCKACMAKKLDTMYCAGCQLQQSKDSFSICKRETPGNWREKKKRRCNTCIENRVTMLRAEWASNVASVQRPHHRE